MNAKTGFSYTLAAALVLGLPLTTLSACAATDSTPSGTPQSNTTVAPASPVANAIRKRPELLDGTEVKVPIKRVMVLAVTEDANTWIADIADPTIAEFIAGNADQAPTFKPLAEGSTDVSLKDSSGKTLTFTLTVTPGDR